jgi:hypothetical protein
MRTRNVVGAVLVAMTMVVAAAAPALARIKVASIHYESPGPDTGSNASLNAEFITIKNTGSHVKRLRGWTLVDKRTVAEGGNDVFRFPRYRLRPGHTVRIHTGQGTRNPGDLYWGKRHYVWGDDADTAYLFNRAGVRVDRCHYVSTTQETSPPAQC